MRMIIEISLRIASLFLRIRRFGRRGMFMYFRVGDTGVVDSREAFLESVLYGLDIAEGYWRLVEETIFLLIVDNLVDELPD